MKETRPVWDNDIERLGLEIQGIASTLIAFGEQFEKGASGQLTPEGMTAALNSMSQHLCRIRTDLTNIAMNNY